MNVDRRPVRLVRRLPPGLATAVALVVLVAAPACDRGGGGGESAEPAIPADALLIDDFEAGAAGYQAGNHGDWTVLLDGPAVRDKESGRRGMAFNVSWGTFGFAFLYRDLEGAEKNWSGRGAVHLIVKPLGEQLPPLRVRVLTPHGEAEQVQPVVNPAGTTFIDVAFPIGEFELQGPGSLVPSQIDTIMIKMDRPSPDYEGRGYLIDAVYVGS